MGRDSLGTRLYAAIVGHVHISCDRPLVSAIVLEVCVYVLLGQVLITLAGEVY